MTLQMAGDGPPNPWGQPYPHYLDDEEEGGEAQGAPVAPLIRTRYHRFKNPSAAECFMTRSSFRDCECGESEDSGGGSGGGSGGSAAVGVGGAPVADKSRRGVVRSCSVGYLDLVESGASNNR